MLAWIKRILAPPVFEDETLTRTAALLNAVLLVCLAATVILFIGLALAGGDNGLAGQVTIVIVLGLLFLLYFAQNSSRQAFQRAQDAEKALRQSEARYRAIVQIQTELVCRNLPDGTLTFVNEAYCRYFDKRPAELMGRSFMPLIPAQDHAAIQKHFASLNQANPIGTHEHRVISPGGEIRWQQWTNQAIFNECGDIVEFQAVGRDVTRCREAEAALRESAERARIISNLVSDFFHSFRIESDGTVAPEWESEMAFRATGFTPEEIEARGGWQSLVHPDDMPLVSQHLQSLLIGQVGVQEYRIVTKSGEARWIRHYDQPIWDETHSRVVRVYGAAQDITQRKQAEQSLRDSEERYRTLVETSPDAITLTDMQGNIIFCNQQAVELYGLEKPEQALGRSAFDFIAPEDRQRALENTQRTLETGSVRRVEYTCLRNDGSRFVGELNASMIRDAAGNPLSFIGVAHDITQRKQAEQALQRYAERLKTLYEIDQAILALHSPEAIARAALERLLHLVPCQRAMVVEFDRGNSPRTLALETERGTDAAAKMANLLAALDMDAFKQGWLQSDQMPDRQSPAWSVHEALLAEGVNSYLMGPLIAEGKLIGLMHLDTRQPDAFTADHQDIVTEVATSLAVAIREARLYEQTRQDAATKSMLLQEINHRVKNNLSAIIGLLYAEQRHAGIQEQPIYQSIMRDLINRVHGMATVHRLLSDSEWSPLLLSELAAQVIRSTFQAVPPGQSVTVNVSPSSVRVTPRQTTSLALVINELATNTIKYALPGRDTAQINVRIAAQGAVVCLEFGDDGPGYPEDVLRQERTEVGLYLAQAIVSDELKGKLSFCNDSGALASIRFRLAASED